MILSKFRYFFFLLILFPVFSNAQFPCRNDECYKMVTPNNFKISKKEFYARYANNNDTAKAIINMFFAKRSISLVKIVAPILVSAAAIVFAANALKKATSLSDTTQAFAYFAPALSLVLFPPSGISESMEFSRENLLYTLIDFKRKNGLANRYLPKLKKYYPKKS